MTTSEERTLEQAGTHVWQPYFLYSLSVSKRQGPHKQTYIPADEFKSCLVELKDSIKGSLGDKTRTDVMDIQSGPGESGPMVLVLVHVPRDRSQLADQLLGKVSTAWSARFDQDISVMRMAVDVCIVRGTKTAAV